MLKDLRTEGLFVWYSGDMLFNRTPKWIRELPYELDKAALQALAKASKGPFEKPREMNFVVYDFSNIDDITSATHQLQQAGWKCLNYEQSDEMGKFAIEAQKNDYIINVDNYTNDVAYFHRIADLYEAKYEGWFASS